MSPTETRARGRSQRHLRVMHCLLGMGRVWGRVRTHAVLPCSNSHSSPASRIENAGQALSLGCREGCSMCGVLHCRFSMPRDALLTATCSNRRTILQSDSIGH